MPIFQYKAIDNTGKEFKDSITAESIIQAKSKVRSQGVMIINITEKKSKAKGSSSFSFGKKVNVNDLAMMTRQLATLVRAKIQIVEALSALQDQVENEHLRVILSEVKQDVNQGASLAKALAKHPKVFSNVYINMVEAGEESGNLEIVLLRLADFTEAQRKLLVKVQSAMMYPMIMIVVGTLLISGIFIAVIPKLAKIFEARKMELPLPTKICIGISDFLQNYWMLIPLFIIFFIWIFKKWKASERGERVWHGFVLRLPILGNLNKMINVSRFCSTLGTLLNSGVPILMSMKIVKNLVPNVLMKEAIDDAKEAVQEGASMAPPLKASGHFPPMVTHMITLGENSGELEEMLGIIAENYEDQVEAKLDGLTATLEPIMIVVMGAAVFFIVFSVIMPMMKMNQV
ncbi:MAG: type II secretion system protein GspF [Halobacteriovoraceae bacterium]|nr:type II secretion system protein GspF [Halobacteriovoraceae bacterium]|tara:strand:+ start:4252 stop:5457 length:1206 start_codon:yes stop_codon:yes gene_type:complete